jgi:hypothetical protein
VQRGSTICFLVLLVLLGESLIKITGHRPGRPIYNIFNRATAGSNLYAFTGRRPSAVSRQPAAGSRQHVASLLTGPKPGSNL